MNRIVDGSPTVKHSDDISSAVPSEPKVHTSNVICLHAISAGIFMSVLLFGAPSSHAQESVESEEIARCEAAVALEVVSQGTNPSCEDMVRHSKDRKIEIVREKAGVTVSVDDPPPIELQVNQ